MSYDPNFVITFHSDESRDEIWKWFARQYPDLWPPKTDAKSRPDNSFKPDYNTLYDPSRLKDDDGYFHYRYELVVIWMTDVEIDEMIMQRQADLASKVLQDLKAHGYKARIDASDVEQFM